MFTVLLSVIYLILVNNLINSKNTNLNEIDKHPSNVNNKVLVQA